MASQSHIVIRGAQEHNLKGVDLSLPRDSLVVFTGLSGSGKSSLAFDTIFKEGQRRFMESLSAYARQFLGTMEKPRVDHIEGLSPTISIDQKTINRNPRSTVGTITEIFDHLRLLFARLGTPHCPQCGREVSSQTPGQIAEALFLEALGLPDEAPETPSRGRPKGRTTRARGEEVLPAERKVGMEPGLETEETTHGPRLSEGQGQSPAEDVEPMAGESRGRAHPPRDPSRAPRGMILAPIVQDRKGEYRKELGELLQEGFLRARIDGELRDLREEIVLDRYVRHTIEVVLDRVVFEAESKSRVIEAVEKALAMTNGLVSALVGDRHLTFAVQRACPDCQISIPEMEPRLFSFNSPHGYCPDCLGLGERAAFTPELVVPDPALSVREGAVACLTREGRIPFAPFGLEELFQVLAHFGATPDTPWRSLPEEARHALLYGSQEVHYTYTWSYQRREGEAQGTTRRAFDGIVPALETAWKFTRAEFLEPFRHRSPCHTCHGKRLSPVSLAVTFHGHNIWDLTTQNVEAAQRFFSSLDLSPREAAIGREIFKEINARLHFLLEVGLGYLSLDRSAATLSGGEAQRIRLASQVGSGLQGVLYVLDEPSIGLHPRDNRRLLQTLLHLRDLGNTVLVVEHDRETMEQADYLVDFGPGAGREGGQITARGTLPQVLRTQSLTARYLRGEEDILVPAQRRVGSGEAVVVRGARQNNLKMLDVRFPLGTFIAVTGVSGSGKSTLVTDILHRSLARELHRSEEEPGAHTAVEGIALLDKVIEIDQSPIGRTPRSNPVTYTKVFDLIRSLFASLPEARMRGYAPGRFSFNRPGGRCEECQGAGVKEIEMQFLANVEIPCEACGGKRFNHETLTVHYKGKSINDVLEMTVAEARVFFANQPKIVRTLQTLLDVGLDYVTLGQPSTTLSGGEAQRVKLATELQRPATGRTLYILDEPTTGLHVADIRRLLEALQRLVDAGNTVVVIEHNLDVVKVADHVIDLGPDGGDGGGRLVGCGTPEVLATLEGSYTGAFLRDVLRTSRREAPRAVVPVVVEPRRRGRPAKGRKEVLEAGPASLGSDEVPLSREVDEAAGSSMAPQAGVEPEPQHEIAPAVGPQAASSAPLEGAKRSDEGVASGVSSQAGLATVLPWPSPGRAARPRPRDLTVRGAHKNNLKHVDVVVPRNKLTIVTGVSGSGKTSLAFDTLFAEGQRRYVESLSTYARRFLGRLDKAPVESIDGIAPSISVDQKAASRSPRSTVATATEIHDYLRLLYARVGEPHCPTCGTRLEGYTPERAADRLLQDVAGSRVEVLAPLFFDETMPVSPEEEEEALLEGRERKHSLNVATLLAEGFLRLRVDDQLVRLDTPDAPQVVEGHRLELVMDRVKVSLEDRSRLISALEAAFGKGDGVSSVRLEDGRRVGLSTVPGCLTCGFFLQEELTPQHFSFNSHVGACHRCDGLGVTDAVDDRRLISAPTRPVLAALHPGVLKQLERRNGRHLALLEVVMHAERIDARLPWKSLSEDKRRLILEGGGDRFYALEHSRQTSRAATRSSLKLRWRGLKPLLEAIFQEARQTQDKQLEDLKAFMHEVPCPACRGGRLKPLPLAVKVGGQNISQVSRLTVTDSLAFFRGLALPAFQQAIARQIQAEIASRLGFLQDVGLEYLTLDRSSATLSGGESQRIRLASQLGSHLLGVLYVLDEPTVGLHPRDTERLLRTLEGLRDRGNTVVVVEHDAQTIRRADHILDLGPGAGERGGRVVASGTPKQLMRDRSSVTGAFLAGRRSIPVPLERRKGVPGVSVVGARANNLQGVSVHFPMAALTCVTGVSGSGKSSLVMQVLAAGLGKHFSTSQETPGAHERLEVDRGVQASTVIDQSPLGRSPRSNPASYIGVMDLIRELYASTPLARSRGYEKGRFSFNMSGGRCEACEGRGAVKVEMHFLSDVWMPCEHCGGKRYNASTLEVKHRGKSIADVLDLEVNDAIEFFANHPRILRLLRPLEQVGLGYMRVGQPANTMSGGEAQRVKVAEALMERSKRSLIILDEPTTGLHFQDVEKLVLSLQRLVDRGHGVVVIEHNPDVMKVADLLVDLGPEGGARGGALVALGTPEEVAAVVGSHTGQALKEVLEGAPRAGRPGEYGVEVVEEGELGEEEGGPLEREREDALDGEVA